MVSVYFIFLFVCIHWFNYCDCFALWISGISIHFSLHGVNKIKQTSKQKQILCLLNLTIVLISWSPSMYIHMYTYRDFDVIIYWFWLHFMTQMYRFIPAKLRKNTRKKNNNSQKIDNHLVCFSHDNNPCMISTFV